MINTSTLFTSGFINVRLLVMNRDICTDGAKGSRSWFKSNNFFFISKLKWDLNHAPLTRCGTKPSWSRRSAHQLQLRPQSALWYCEDTLFSFQFEADSESRSPEHDITLHQVTSIKLSSINNKMPRKWRENSSSRQTSSWAPKAIIFGVSSTIPGVSVKSWPGVSERVRNGVWPGAQVWPVVCGPRLGLSQGTREKTGARVTVSSLKSHVSVAFCRQRVKTLLSDL